MLRPPGDCTSPDAKRLFAQGFVRMLWHPRMEKSRFGQRPFTFSWPSLVLGSLACESWFNACCAHVGLRLVLPWVNTNLCIQPKTPAASSTSIACCLTGNLWPCSQTQAQWEPPRMLSLAPDCGRVRCWPALGIGKQRSLMSCKGIHGEF